MMLSREVRRVPLDFNAPIHKTWEGYVRPSSLSYAPCEVCGPPTAIIAGGLESYGGTGDGLSPEARQLSQTWYGHIIDWHNRPRALALEWSNKLGQHEIDALIEKGRLNPVIDCPRGCQTPDQRGIQRGQPWRTDCSACQGAGWTRKQLKAGDVTRETLSQYLGPFGHDSINQSICVKARCALLGFDYLCEWCDGDGISECTEKRLAHETWAPTEPPTGDAYQLWQTVSEGGPCSPPFATLKELAAWLSKNDDTILKGKTPMEWMKILQGEVAGTDIGTGALV